MDMDLVNLGYCIAYNGKHMFIYRLKHNDEQHVIYDFREVYSKDNQWVHFLTAKGRTFDSDTLNSRHKLKIIKALPDVEKVDNLIDMPSNIDNFFFEPEPEVEEVPYVKPLGVWSPNEVNDMLSVFNEGDLKYEGKIKISKKLVKYAKKEYGYNLLDELLGYKVKCKVKGNHKNDGQLVEYYFTIISPDKVKTKFDTEMCLMVGWNYYQDLILIK